VRLRGRQKCKFLNARWAILERVKVALYTRGGRKLLHSPSLSGKVWPHANRAVSQFSHPAAQIKVWAVAADSLVTNQLG